MKTPAIGTNELYSQLEVLLNTNTPLFIHGSPGIGKSYIVNDVAKSKGWEIVDVRLSQLDPVDLRGIPTIRDDSTKWMPPIFFPRDEKSEGVLFLDELNSAPPSVQVAIYQLVLDRKLGEYELPSKWKIVCAGNRISDKGVIFRLPSPLANRMIHILLEANLDDFKTWAIRNEIHPFVIGFLGFRPDLLSMEVPKDHEVNPAFATPRSWSMLSNILKSTEDLDLIAPIIYGSVGYSAGVEFLAYTKVYQDLPDTSAILDGEEVAIPNKPDVLYALTSAIIEKYNGSEAHSKNILSFSYKLSVEFCVMLIKDAIVKYEEISEVSEFDDWIEKYGEYII